jgi:hypothetical protein
MANADSRVTIHRAASLDGFECLRLGLANDIRYSILPISIGDGISFFDNLDRDIALHLAEVKAYKSGMVGLWYEVRVNPSSEAVAPNG